jgi:glycosyltransferase involved in cell wall biosynthesis
VKRVLFASSPHFFDRDVDNYFEKGVDLLLDSFASVVNKIPATLVILWRKHYTNRLIEDVRRRDLTSHVEIVDENVNVNDYYDSVDMAVIPYRSLWRSPAVPLSGVEALCHGIPLALTDVSELSKWVDRCRCGETSPPTQEGLSDAICSTLSSLGRYQGGLAEFRRWYLHKQVESLGSLRSHLQ